MKRKLIYTFLTLLCLAAITGIWAGIVLYNLSKPPMGNKVIIVHIERGMTLGEVSRMLESEGLVKSAEYISWLGERKGLDTKIKAGEYELSSDWYPEKILTAITSGKVVARRFTIPEGYTLKQIAQTLDDSGIVGKSEFIKAAADISMAAEWLPESAKNLEGVLFPDTYTYTKNDDAKSIVTMMVARFGQVFAPLWSERDRKPGMSPYEAITLASIVEKETAADEERTLVAGVFFNRLKLGMRLMSDPTVIYGIPNFNGDITRKDLRTPTPYNTYVNSGLPPGPICNPGAPSIEAALHPAPTKALYFVATRNGKHHFSETLDEHNKAVRKYQKRRGTD